MAVQLVLLGGIAETGRLGAAIRDYSDVVDRKGARSAAHRWFDNEYLALMAEHWMRALAYTRAAPHLPGVLTGRRDGRVIDSTTVLLLRTLAESIPATGDYGSLKVRVEVSLGCENVVDYHITPARQHGSTQQVVDEIRHRTCLIVDLG